MIQKALNNAKIIISIKQIVRIPSPNKQPWKRGLKFDYGRLYENT